MKKLSIILLFLVIAFSATTGSASSSDDTKFFLIHLDAVSTHHIQQEMEKGNLPNLQNFFEDQGRIDYTITYFPSKTPTVISSLRSGFSPDESALPGWKRPAGDDNGRTIGMATTFLEMAFSKSRLSMSNLIYGLPAFHWLAGPAMINAAYYLKDYDIIQFYWYNVDTQGHFHGEEAYIRELIEFDRQFGKLVNHLDDEVNVVIYADHGMTFGEGITPDEEIEEIIGDDMAVFSYPTLYLNNSTRAEHYARRLVDETEVDFTFVRRNAQTLRGYHKDAVITLRTEGYNRVRYEYEGEDVLGFYSEGYNGEYLDREEWLEQSYQSRYPMAPISLKTHFNNPNAADIIVLFDRNKYYQTGYSQSGNHGGFTDQDMTTMLFLRGEHVSKLYGQNYFWLPDLFARVDGIDFDSHPPRERHTLVSRYDFRRNRMVSEVSFSPIYRVRYGANFYMEDEISSLYRSDVWGKVDLFRDYFNRFWLGTGVEIEDGDITPMLMFQHDLHIRRFVFQSSVATNRQFYFRTSWEVLPWLAFETVNFNSLGVRIDF